MIFLVLCVNQFSGHLDLVSQDLTPGWLSYFLGFFPPHPRLSMLPYLLLGASEGLGLVVT